MAVERDPQGNIDRYAAGCEDILRNSAARHIIGCVTSWSRKEVIPVLEKAGGTLWYACPYEGFEANEHVVYMHACPNQHLVPLLGYVVPRFGANGFLTGSNYIWGWETNRVARDLIADAGGKVLGERYLPLGETDVARLIAEIEATRPDFVLNNLIGPSSYAFIAAYAELAARDPHFRPERCPILSCISPSASCRRSAMPATDTCRWGLTSDASPAGPPARVVTGGSRPCVGAGAGRNPCAQPRRALDRPSQGFRRHIVRHAAGPHRVDPQTQHATLPVEIGRIEQAGFKTVSLTKGVAPDPDFLATTAPRPLAGHASRSFMSRASRIPNLGGAKAFVLHRPHPTVQAISRQLSAIGLDVTVCWPELPVEALAADFVFFDTDLGFDEQFPWKPGAAPMPLVALIGSEAPGRIEWALSHNADAQLLKPVGTAGVYSALLIARQSFEAQRQSGSEIAALRQRVAERQTIVRAAAALSKSAEDGRAYAQLRSLAMGWQVSIEEAARRIVAMTDEDDGDDQSHHA